jgi:hypothetical protein
MADEGIGEILQCYFNNITTKLRLFGNNPVISRGMNFSTFTEVASGGYGPISLSAGLWVYDADPVPVNIAYAQQTFTFTSGLSPDPAIYGWFISDVAGTKVICAKLLGSPFTPTTPGDTLKITPILYASGGIPI